MSKLLVHYPDVNKSTTITVREVMIQLGSLQEQQDSFEPLYNDYTRGERAE